MRTCPGSVRSLSDMCGYSYLPTRWSAAFGAMARQTSVMLLTGQKSAEVVVPIASPADRTPLTRVSSLCRVPGEAGGFFAGTIFVSMSGENWACVA